jgi:hypothetical protein
MISVIMVSPFVEWLLCFFFSRSVWEYLAEVRRRKEMNKLFDQSFDLCNLHLRDSASLREFITLRELKT